MDDLPENWRDAPFLATINATSPRLSRWLEGYGCRSVPVVSPLSQRAVLPGYPDGAEVYRLDIRRFTPDQLERLAAVLSRVFGIPTSEVLERLKDPAQGCPVLAEDVSVPIPLRFIL